MVHEKPKRKKEKKKERKKASEYGIILNSLYIWNPKRRERLKCLKI